MTDSEQTRMIRESALDFVTRSDALIVARATRNTDNAPLRAAMGEAGWFGLLVPDEDGGHGGKFSDMAALCEELARALSESSILRTAVHGCRTLVHCPPGPQRTALLNRMVDGTLSLAVAWHGDELSFDDACDISLHGTAAHVHCDIAAEGILCLAKSATGPALICLPLASQGLRVEREWLVDGTAAVTIQVEGLRVPQSNVLATGDAARDAFDRACLEATAMASAALLGVMDAAFELTRSYLCTRVQFGKPIGSFQALAHRSVDQYIQRQLARDVVSRAAELLDSADASAAWATVHRAKARCSDAAMKITREAIQMHGAIGFTDEYNAGLYLKRAVVLNAWLGNSAYHRARFDGRGDT